MVFADELRAEPALRLRHSGCAGYAGNGRGLVLAMEGPAKAVAVEAGGHGVRPFHLPDQVLQGRSRAAGRSNEVGAPGRRYARQVRVRRSGGDDGA